MDDPWTGLAGLIVLGIVIAVFALGYFVWSSIRSWYLKRHSAPGTNRTLIL
jgi:hypothetical protein